MTGNLVKSTKKIPIDLNALCGQTIREHVILRSLVTDTDNCIDVCIQIKLTQINIINKINIICVSTAVKRCVIFYYIHTVREIKEVLAWKLLYSC